MDGFSERGSDLEIGHLFGLRWFQLAETPDLDGDRAEEDQIRQARQRVWEECKMLADMAAMRPQAAFTSAEQQRWDDLNYQLDALDTRLAALWKSRPPLIGLRGSRGPWLPGENEAVCARPEEHRRRFRRRMRADSHLVPKRGCGCGFWAYWALGQKMVYPPSCVGLIKGYGRTIEGTKGFRCSHAKIEAIWMPTWDDSVALELRSRYQVPVYYKIGAMLRLHPAPDGQRPLTDEWSGSSEGRRFLFGAGGRHYDRAYDDYGKPLGGYGLLVMECARCGRKNCGPGQPRCVRCEIRYQQILSSPHAELPGGITMTGPTAVYASGGNVTGPSGSGGSCPGGSGGSTTVTFHPAGGSVAYSFQLQANDLEVLRTVIEDIKGHIRSVYGQDAMRRIAMTVTGPGADPPAQPGNPAPPPTEDKQPKP